MLGRGVSLDGLVRSQVFKYAWNIESLRVVQRSGDVGEGDDSVTLLVHQQSGRPAHISCALNNNPRIINVETELLTGLVAYEQQSAPGCLPPAT